MQVNAFRLNVFISSINLHGRGIIDEFHFDNSNYSSNNNNNNNNNNNKLVAHMTKRDPTPSHVLEVARYVQCQLEFCDFSILKAKLRNNEMP